MMQRMGSVVRSGAVVIVLALFMGGCGGGGGGGTAPVAASGAVNVSVTDAPVLEFDHVWITVREIWFHTSDVADPAISSGWLKYPLPAPVTVDLATLSNGALQKIWPNLALPAGSYQQIRLFLAATEDLLVANPPPGVTLAYNNEIDIGTNKYPLRIPTPSLGIRLIPETPLLVTPGGTVNIAIDFDADDVVEFQRGAVTEYILKPRLGYFDLDRAGAITGSILTPLAAGATFSNYTGFNFVIKAEQPDRTGTYRVVRRATTIDSYGNFVLYPLPIFGSATTAKFDIVMRGRNVLTTIVKQVPAHRGTTPATATSVGPQIAMLKGPEYAVNVRVNPTGSWLDFYQTLPGDPVPYEIRFRHANPFTGSFFAPILLSAGQLQTGTWNNGAAVSFSPVDPTGGPGSFNAVADALLYNRSVPVPVTPTTVSPVNFSPLMPSTPAANAATLNIVVPPVGNMDSGIVLATLGGMIVDKRDVPGSVMGSGGTFVFDNLPGGTPANPFPLGVYGMFVLGWDAANPMMPLHRAVGFHFADLRTSSTLVTLMMLGF